jgi:mRNA interferase MazF
MRRGEIRWYTFAAPDKRRPVLLLTRDEVIDALNEIIVVPVTRTIRGIATEVLLSSSDDGMPTDCALNFDHVSLAQRSRLGPVLTMLPQARWPDVERALLIACGFPSLEKEAVRT